MENDIALMASGYLLARLGILAALGYLVYRVLRPRPARAHIKISPGVARAAAGRIRTDR